MKAFVEEATSMSASKAKEDLKDVLHNKYSSEKKRLGNLQRRHSSKRNTSPVSCERAKFEQTGLLRMSRNGPQLLRPALNKDLDMTAGSISLNMTQATSTACYSTHGSFVVPTPNARRVPRHSYLQGLEAKYKSASKPSIEPCYRMPKHRLSSTQRRSQ